MTLEQIFDLQRANDQQKLEFKLKAAKQKTRAELISLVCVVTQMQTASLVAACFAGVQA